MNVCWVSKPLPEVYNATSQRRLTVSTSPIYTYLLTPWCRVLLEKLTSLQLVKKFPAFYGTRRFLTALTSVRYLSLSCASPIQSTYPHPTSWRSILILSTHLRLGLPSGLFPYGNIQFILFLRLPYFGVAVRHYHVGPPHDGNIAGISMSAFNILVRFQCRSFTTNSLPKFRVNFSFGVISCTFRNSTRTNFLCT